jgi:hypothetical protein
MFPSYISATYSNLYVKNTGESALWYSEHFGFKVLSIHDKFATLLIAPGRILFLNTGEDMPRNIGFLTHNIVELHRHLKQRGLELDDQSNDQHSTWFSLKDPSGNYIEIWVGDRFGMNNVKFSYPPEMEQLKHGCDLLNRPATRIIAVACEVSASLEHGELTKAKEQLASSGELDTSTLNEWVCLMPNRDPGETAEASNDRITIYLGFAVKEEQTATPTGWTTIELREQLYARFPLYDHPAYLSKWLHNKYKWLSHWDDVMTPTENQPFSLMVPSGEYYEVLIPYQLAEASQGKLAK